MKKSTIYILLIVTASLMVSCGTSDGNDKELDLGPLVVSSNTNATIGFFDFSDIENVTSVQLGNGSVDSDGIVYLKDQDRVIIVSRTNNSVYVFDDVSKTESGGNLSLTASSQSDFNNPRKIAVSGNSVVVAQDANDANNQQNALFVYEINSGELSLQNTFNTNINLWDIQFVGSALYAIADNSDSLAIYDNFLSNSGSAITPTKKIQIEGIVRTHALYYSEDSDILFMTDIGDAGSDTDGAVHIISGFASKLSQIGNNDQIPLVDQFRIEGPNTELGNPVGVTYDANTQRMFIAERAQNGGKLLAFDMRALTANLTPVYSSDYSGATDLYLYQD